MADKTSLITSNATDRAHARSPLPHAAAEHPVAAPPLAARLESMCGACLCVGAVVLMGYIFGTTVWRARDDPGDLAFVGGAGALLAALLACLRRAERLTPASPPEERRRVQAAVWLISTVLSCAFAYRVAAIMPPALAVLVWCMTALVVLVGFCLLVLCKDEDYQCLEEVEDDAGDAKVFNKIRPNDELV